MKVAHLKNEKREKLKKHLPQNIPKIVSVNINTENAPLSLPMIVSDDRNTDNHLPMIT